MCFTWLRALLDGVQGQTAQVLGPVAENPLVATRKNNSAHVFYIFEKCDIPFQASQSLFEGRRLSFGHLAS